MLANTTVAVIVNMLAAGEGERAQSYLQHFPRADRAPAAVRAQLAERVVPEVMEVFERLAPWLVRDEVDDTPERVRVALRAAERDGLNLTELSKAVSRVRPDAMLAVLDGLVAEREVVFEREKTGGRTANRYRLVEFADGIKAANEMDDPFADRSHLG